VTRPRRRAIGAAWLLAFAVHVDAQVDAGAAMALAEKNLCFSCHKVEVKVVGPAYKDVAAKYRGDQAALDRLVAKVTNGGKGVWGAIPMPAHKDMTDADIRTIVTWVLSLGDEQKSK
jgi:cytochrome c